MINLVKYFRSGEMIVVTTESDVINYNSVSPHYWVPASVISTVMSLYTLIYASIYTDGFETSCKQYRDTLLKEFSGIGNIVPIVKGRLSCASIFDFMDYLQEDISFERRRYGRINTASCLYISLVGAWCCCFAWIAISFINIVQLQFVE